MRFHDEYEVIIRDNRQTCGPFPTLDEAVDFARDLAAEGDEGQRGCDIFLVSRTFVQAVEPVEAS